MESLRNAYRFLKESWRRAERQEEAPNVNEARAAIRRVASRLRISEDRATVLLVNFHWDESRIDSGSLLSRYFVSNPQFGHQPSMRHCRICNVYALCKNLGCGHYSCGRCFLDYIWEKILAGELDVVCPYIGCGLYLSHAIISEFLSEEVKATYRRCLYESWLSAQPQDTLLVSLLRKGKELVTSVGNSLGYSDRELIFLALLLMYETKSYFRI